MLAAALNMPKATVTLYVKRLEAAGFLRREIDTRDLRRHRLKLTPSGRKTARQGMKLLALAFEPCLDRLSEAQQQELKEFLERMTVGLRVGGDLRNRPIDAMAVETGSDRNG